MNIDRLFDAAAAAAKPDTTLTIRRPDDWHVHLRDGAMLQGRAALHGARSSPAASSCRTWCRRSPRSRRRRRTASASSRSGPAGSDFEPLMTCYLTDRTSPDEIEKGFAEKVWVAAKLYPAGATTNAHHGVTNIPALARFWSAWSGSACRC